jgi:hypothetical protein
LAYLAWFFGYRHSHRLIGSALHADSRKG